jgi:hypothetical protein
MRLTAISFPWADQEEVTFDLPLGEVRKLQEKTGAGPPVILSRIVNDTWMVDDYRETILQGLLGAKMPAKEAAALVREWVDQRPAKESLIPAQAILLAFIMGAPEKKPVAVETGSKDPAMAPENLTSSQSMEPALPSE